MKKRNKKYHKKPIGFTLVDKILLVARVMKPIESMIESLEKYGTLTTVQTEGREFVVMEDYGEMSMYEMLPAAEGFLEFFGIWETRKNKCLYLEPLYTLIRKIGKNEMVTMAEIQAAKKSINNMRNALNQTPVPELKDLVKTAQIKFELEKQAA